MFTKKNEASATDAIVDSLLPSKAEQLKHAWKNESLDARKMFSKISLFPLLLAIQACKQYMHSTYARDLNPEGIMCSQYFKAKM